MGWIDFLSSVTVGGAGCGMIGPMVGLPSVAAARAPAKAPETPETPGCFAPGLPAAQTPSRKRHDNDLRAPPGQFPLKLIVLEVRYLYH